MSFAKHYNVLVKKILSYFIIRLYSPRDYKIHFFLIYILPDN